MTAGLGGSRKACDRLLLGVLLILVLVVGLFTWLWSGLLDGYREMAEDARYRTAQFLRIAQRQDELQADLNAPQLQAQIRQNYLTGEAPGVAYASLQQQIKELIAGIGGLVLSTQLVQQPQDEEQVTEKIMVRVRMQGDTLVLQKVMQALEERRPLMFFEQLNIQAPAKVKEDEAEKLDIRFDIYGYFWKGPL
ncbi:MAG: type II secretion system protein GspM [Candidatus Thiodiazotropha sp.]